MRIIDANVVLRYVLDDHFELSAKARAIIDENIVCIPIEVLSEVIYVLHGIYKTERDDIYTALHDFFEKTVCILPHRNAILHALKLYGESKLDFVDCVLAGYSQVEGAIIDTFDKKLQRLLSQ